MLLSLLKLGFISIFVVALLKVYCRHDITAHWVAVRKCGFLWVVSTSPVICAALLSEPAQQLREGALDPSIQFESTLYAAFSLGEQFIYAAAFMAPVMYIYVEAVAVAVKSDSSESLADVRRRLRGYGALMLPALVLLVLVVLSFGASKSPETFQSTYLFLFLGSQSLAIYLLALGLWYASVLLDTAPNMNFAEEARAENRKFIEAFRQRRRRGSAK